MRSSATAYIDISALKHNFSQVKQYAPESKVLAMVKSDAYGHGLLQVVTALTAADGYGVASFNEALVLREAGVQKPILIMRGFLTEEELLVAAENNLSVVVHDVSQLSLLQQTAISQPISVWLKIDTGMHRLGFLPDHVRSIYDFLENSPKVQKPINIMTHFSDADDLQKNKTVNQLRNFFLLDLPGPKSLANSAAIITMPDAHADWVRPGIMLYGIAPIIAKTGSDYNLQPVMTLKSKIINLKSITAGSPVGYGETWSCEKDTLIGVVAIGYGDGYPRHVANGAPVLVHGVKCPIVGRVSMDMLAIDLTNVTDVEVNDEVILWGQGLPVEVIAEYAQTNAYELLCQLTQRVQFILV